MNYLNENTILNGNLNFQWEMKFLFLIFFFIQKARTYLAAVPYTIFIINHQEIFLETANRVSEVNYLLYKYL